MPYFVFKVFPNKRLELVESAEKYADAKRRARAMRAQLMPDADHTVNLIFAQNSEEAERLLKEKREPRPLGEDA